MNLLLIILCAFLAIILLALVLVRHATANFKRLRMGYFFDLEARDQESEVKDQLPLATCHSPLEGNADVR